jgi:RNA polymerase sigma-70 factor (ECF subfamily)
MDDDIKLVELTLKGDRAAFERLVLRYQNYVFTIARRVLPSREDAEEAAQDAFLKVYTTLGSFERKSKFSTWLYTVAYRTAIDKARLKRLPIDSIDADGSFFQLADHEGDSPAGELQRQNLSQQLDLAIKRLKPADATVVTLFYLHETPVKEIAQITGLSLSNVKTKLHRVRESLKEELSKQLHEEIQDLL